MIESVVTGYHKYLLNIKKGNLVNTKLKTFLEFDDGFTQSNNKRKSNDYAMNLSAGSIEY